MDGLIGGPEDAHERLAAWKGRIDRLAAETQAMGERFQQLRVTATDPSGMAEVTIDSTGALVDLRLDQRIQRVAPETVARTIMDTVRTAKVTAAERSQDIIDGTLGPRSAIGGAIAEQVDRRVRRPRRDDDEPDELSWR